MNIPANTVPPNLADLFRHSTVPPAAQAKLIGAAKGGKPQVVDPHGTGMTGAMLAQILQAAGNGR